MTLVLQNLHGDELPGQLLSIDKIPKNPQLLLTKQNLSLGPSGGVLQLNQLIK